MKFHQMQNKDDFIERESESPMQNKIKFLQNKKRCGKDFGKSIFFLYIIHFIKNKMIKNILKIFKILTIEIKGVFQRLFRIVTDRHAQAQ